MTTTTEHRAAVARSTAKAVERYEALLEELRST